jgi:hypothetical protein
MNGVRRAARRLRLTGRRLVGGVKECMYWQRRATTLFLAADRYTENPNKAPDTYAEFLARTTGPLIREPSARARFSGRTVG